MRLAGYLIIGFILFAAGFASLHYDGPWWMTFPLFLAASIVLASGIRSAKQRRDVQTQSG